MIEINELRIGNLFHDEDKTPCYFAGIWYRDDGWVIRDSAGNTYKPMQIYPLALTHEMLEKFGFSYVSMMFGGPDSVMQYYRNDWLIIERGGIVVLFNDKEVQLNVECKYLHQLQNLHFALTGKELNIKL